VDFVLQAEAGELHVHEVDGGREQYAFLSLDRLRKIWNCFGIVGPYLLPYKYEVNAGSIFPIYGVDKHVNAGSLMILETVFVAHFRNSRERTSIHENVDIIRRASVIHLTRTHVQEHGKAADDSIFNSRAFDHGTQAPDGVHEFADMHVVHGERDH